MKLVIDIVTDLTRKEVDELVERTIMLDSYVLGGEGLVEVQTDDRS